MQVKENINLANLLSVGNNANASYVKTNENKVGNDFEKYFHDSKQEVKYFDDSNGFNQREDINNKATNETDCLELDNHDFKNVICKEKEVSKKDSNLNDDLNLNDLMNLNEIVERFDLSDEQLNDILSLFASTFQLVMEKFQISSEELIHKLEEFKMTPMDLMNPDGLKEFFLNMKDADVSVLLSNENFNLELQEFIDRFDALLKEHDISQDEVHTFMNHTDLESLFQNIDTFKKILGQFDLEQNSFDDFEMINQEETDSPEVIIQNDVEEPQNHEKQTMNHHFSDSDSKQDWNQNMVIAHSDKNSRNAVEGPFDFNEFQQNVINSLKDAFHNVETVMNMDQNIESRDVINQIVEQIKIQVTQETNSIELQLYPEHLGKIQIHVVSKEGVMTARIVAETEAAKQAIESGLSNLKEALQNQNLKVDAVEVMVSTTGFEHNQDSNQAFDDKQTSSNRRKINLADLSEEDLGEEEQIQIEKMKAQGSSVSFQA